jgi:hypothetical protein
VEGVLEETEVRFALGELVARKQSGDELAMAAPVPALSGFVKHELSRLNALDYPADNVGDQEALNRFFRSYALAE